MRYGSVCSGIEAATAAWHPLGWDAAFFSEIENFPRAVLEHHYPEVPLHGDFTTIGADDYGSIDILVGGTPCQSFSIAGLRKGMDDDRGNLALEFLKLAQRKSPTWLVWENVPGVLSSNGGRDFGAFLGGLVELGYGFAYRVLDAQYFGVAQRRRRVFVVGYLGDWRRAAAVLFERESLSGHPAPRRETREEVAACLTRGVGQRYDFETETLPIAFGAQNSAKQGDSVSKHVTPTLDKSKTPAVAFAQNQTGEVREGQVFNTLNTNSNASGRNTPLLRDSMTVRRLTPIECERLQGFPDNYTQIPWRNKAAEDCPDGPRYKALGNSMAVPVMKWIGSRINKYEQESSSKRV